MKIGILGAGMIGGTVGALWHAAGHEIRFGTRHPDELRDLLGKLGARASAGPADEAVRFADVVLLAVPLKAVPELSKLSWSGKVVLDATNPYPDRDGDLATRAAAHPRGSSGWVAEHLQNARVVKAFNTVYFKTLEAQAHKGQDLVGIPLAADDEAALRTAAALVRDAGFEPVAIGELARGKDVQPGAKVYNTGMRASELRAVFPNQ